MNNLFRVFRFGFLCALVCFGTHSIAAHNSRLSHINHQIQLEKKHLDHVKKHRSALQDNLKDIELHISKLITQQRQIQKSLHESAKTIQSIQNNLNQLSKHITKQTKQLGVLLQAQYRLGTQTFLQQLLSNTSPETRQRMHRYYQYLNQSRLVIIKSVKQHISDLHNQQQAIEHQKQHYQTLLADNKKMQQMLLHASDHRTRLLAHINKTIASHAAKLNTLLHEKASLEQAITQVQNNTPLMHNSFASNFSRHMLWPTKGRRILSFGKRIDHSQLTTDGVVIKAPQGQPVYAIANGTVVFSKWMPGYGLLMIINHGYGMMSLYGRNQQLFLSCRPNHS